MRISAPMPQPRARVGGRRAGPLRQIWLFVPIALAAIAAVAFWQITAHSAPAAATTGSVSQGSLTISVTGSGTVAAARTLELPLTQSGTVTSVEVAVGDTVAAGEPLITIDTSDLQLQLQQAHANLKSAQANLAQVQSGSATDADRASAQAQLDSAQAQLAETRSASGTAADIQTARAQLDAAQAQLAALQNPSQLDLNSAQTALAQAQANLQTQSASLSQAKTNAYYQMQQAVNSLTQAQNSYAVAKNNWEYVQATGIDPIQPSQTGANGKKVANILTDGQSQQYASAFVQAQAALGNAQNAVQEAQVAYDSARANEAAQVPLLERAVANAQAQLDALNNPSASDLAQAKAQVASAQASLDKLRQGGTAAQIAGAEAQVTSAKANLESLSAPPTAAALASAEANVLQAQVAVDTAQRNLEQATLTAPFAGVITAVSATAGSSASAGTAAVTLVDISTLHVAVSLSETDAAAVAVGQPVALTFDALPDAAITGTVASIAPSATTSQNVVTYPVQVEFDPGDAPVKVGMSATADIQTKQIDNAILVPSRAIQTAGNSQSVTVLQGAARTPVTVQVTTGLASNGQTEITGCAQTGAQCLRAGDTLAIPSTTTAASTSQQNIRGFDNLGGPGSFAPGGGPPPGLR